MDYGSAFYYAQIASNVGGLGWFIICAATVMLLINGIMNIINTNDNTGYNSSFTTKQATILLCAGVSLAFASDFVPSQTTLKYQIIAEHGIDYADRVIDIIEDAQLID